MPNALLVDDEEDICDFLKEQLEEIGFQVFTAYSGEEALDVVRSQTLDLAVVDMRLSTALTGLDVIRAIQNKWPKASVVAMSGYVDVGLRQETGKLGVAAYFVKPDDVQPSRFTERIREIVSKTQQP